MSFVERARPVLETERLLLRPFQREDGPAMLPILSHREVNRFLPWSPVESLEECVRFLEERLMGPGRYAVCLKNVLSPVGYVTVGGPDSFDLGYGLARRWWGQGLAAEAAGAVAEELRRVGLPCLTATHDVENPASGRVMEKLGMTYRYSYVEQWQPKDLRVTFRLYQLDLDGQERPAYPGYWDTHPEHWVEEIGRDQN